MKLLADENQHPLVVARLRAAGHDVEWVRESSRGAKDPAILQRPDIAGLVLVTDDRDFGDLIFHRRYPAPRAILFNRLKRTEPEAVVQRLIGILALDDFDGQMVTITKDGERRKPFPLGATNG